MIRVTCWQCRKPFRWTLVKCPRCMQRNSKHPVIMVGKALAVAALVVAVWYIVQAFVQTDDTVTGVLRHEPEKEAPKDPRFPR